MSEPPDVTADAARRYAKFGFAVFPVFTIDDGQCSCNTPRCPSPGKHPIGSMVPHGVADAQADERATVEWWSVYPDANIGIATGDVSGIVVIDVDLPGLDTLNNLERIYGDLTATWAAQTGSGGLHLYYRMPNLDIRNSAGAIGPGIDVRGNGGYVVAPPSLHVSGQRYQWQEGWHPRKVELASVPEWFLKKMIPGGRTRQSQVLPRTLTEGTRNTWLASAAGTMRRRGFGQTAIAAALKVENRERCKPPLDDREIDKIAWSVARYDTPQESDRVGA